MMALAAAVALAAPACGPLVAQPVRRLPVGVVVPVPLLGGAAGLAFGVFVVRGLCEGRCRVGEQLRVVAVTTGVGAVGGWVIERRLSAGW